MRCRSTGPDFELEINASLADIVLALLMSTRPSANLRALIGQADTIIAAEVQRADFRRRGPSLPALRALDAIHGPLFAPPLNLYPAVALPAGLR